MNTTVNPYTFRCPKCGSSMFRTDREGTTEVGICKGRPRVTVLAGIPFNDYEGCTFTWPRVHDLRYFKVRK